MHLLPVSTVSLDEGEIAIDLAQPPGDVVVLSFADSDLSALAAAYGRARDILPALRLASLKKLRHPLSVDVYAEKTISGAKAVVVRCLGGLDYWRYGVETLAALCRTRGIALAVLPGDDRDDPRLAAHDTVSPELRAGLDACFRAGGAQNMEAMLRRLARDALGWPVHAPAPCPVPKLFAWDATGGITPLPKPVLEDPAGRTPAIHAAQLARIDALSPAQYGFSHTSAPPASDTDERLSTLQRDEPKNSLPTAVHATTADLPAETQDQHPQRQPLSQQPRLLVCGKMYPSPLPAHIQDSL